MYVSKDLMWRIILKNFMFWMEVNKSLAVGLELDEKKNRERTRT